MSQTILELKLQNITELRLQIDEVLNYVKLLQYHCFLDRYVSKHTILSIKDSITRFINLLSHVNTSLFFAKSFLGIEKGNLGSKNPYPPSETAKNIPPTVDVRKTERELPEIIGKIENDLDPLTQIVNQIRQDISKISSNHIFHRSILNENPCILLCYGNIKEANFSLGAILSEFRDLANIYIPDEKEFY